MQTKDYINIVEDKISETLMKRYGYKGNFEVIQVWYCKTVQNHKGLFIIKDHDDSDRITPFFIEVTYNGDVSELYLDFYTKKHKEIFKEVF